MRVSIGERLSAAREARQEAQEQARLRKLWGEIYPEPRIVFAAWEGDLASYVNGETDERPGWIVTWPDRTTAFFGTQAFRYVIQGLDEHAARQHGEEPGPDLGDVASPTLIHLLHADRYEEARGLARAYSTIRLDA